MQGGTTDPDELAAAGREVELMRRPGISVADFHDADIRFHLSLSRAGGNTAVPLLMQVLRHAIAGHLLTSLQAIDEPAPVLERLAAEHAAILAAVEAGGVERARRLMREHVQWFYAEHAAVD